MRRVRRSWLVVSGALIALLAATFWLYEHRGYPNTVYMQRVSVIHTEDGPGLSTPGFQFWLDPTTGKMRVTGSAVASCSGRWLLTRDWIGCYGAGTGELPLTPQALQDDARFVAAWRRYGFGGPGHVVISLAEGPVAQGSLDARPASIISFTPLNRSLMVQDVYWLDPRSDDIMQEQTLNVVSYSDTYHIIAEEIYAPNALPTRFFDPPNGSSLWARVAGWIDDHTGVSL